MVVQIEVEPSGLAALASLALLDAGDRHLSAVACAVALSWLPLNL